MNNYNVTRLPQPPQQLQVATVTEVTDEQLVLEQSLPAKLALSCLLQPQVGDSVLFHQDNEQRWVIAVLAAGEASSHGRRGDASDRELAVANSTLTLNTQKFTVNSAQGIHFNSLKDISLNAALGQLKVNAKSMLQSVQQSLVQLSKHFFSKADVIDVHASQLAKSHAVHQLITAEKDLKMDADRINMG